MRERRENYDISDNENLEWKLNFKIDNIFIQLNYHLYNIYNGN